MEDSEGRHMHKLILAFILSLLTATMALAFPPPNATAHGPIPGASPRLQMTSTPTPPSSPGKQPPESPAQAGPPLALTLTLLGMCCAFLVLIGVVVLGFLVRRENRGAILPKEGSES